MIIVYDPGNGKPLETMAMSRYAMGTLFKKVWEKETQPDQWKALAELIVEKKSKKIGINTSDTNLNIKYRINKLNCFLFELGKKYKHNRSYGFIF